MLVMCFCFFIIFLNVSILLIINFPSFCLAQVNFILSLWYYTIKEYILEVFDTLYPGKITFSEVLESRFPIQQIDCDIFPIYGKSKNITIEVSVCSKAGYQFLENLLMSPTLGEQFKKEYGIILEKIYVDEVSMSSNVLDLLKEASKKIKKFQNESGAILWIK